ncbi:hypothetical protein EV648_110273 [Kribbella sp. VKM Ac-2568]|nr:hypothetical protein EV648_110273 [Kribbella sp. VKM Ac-2568]
MLADDLAYDGRGVTAAKDEVAQQVAERIAFGPLEMTLRHHFSGVAQCEEDRGDGVGHGGAVGPQYAVTIDLDPLHPQHVTEGGGVDYVNLEEQDVCAVGDWVRGADVALFRGVLGCVAGLPLVGDQVEDAIVAIESVRNPRAASSNSIRSARSSVVRETREISETVMMPAMNRPEMAMPSGFSMMFSTSA